MPSQSPIRRIALAWDGSLEDGTVIVLRVVVVETLVAGIRDQGGEPVLVTPIVRRWFNADGTLDNTTALLVNCLGLPAVIRSVAATEDAP